MDIKDIKDLIITMDKTSIEKVEIEKSDLKIMISKRAINEGNVSKATVDNLEGMKASTSERYKDIQVPIDEISDVVNNNLEDDNENTFIVKSPIVGTFYEAPSPDSPAFASVGDKVEKGQTLCIIEAMKIMNQIECEAAGEVVEIFVSDEDIVEYGQPLMRIRR